MPAKHPRKLLLCSVPRDWHEKAPRACPHLGTGLVQGCGFRQGSAWLAPDQDRRGPWGTIPKVAPMTAKC
ncbi:hypothetical protein CENSYa_1590 [Cenarchaeum symbiosum A]|uniref:Uncharacterized protein n=1 Tax=Cenarchaeum symbiosum (strain A) TaxID=414004 RepID=A0RXZ3_CENSY|nr:hypothetical protein CENSYa_1590 [Cenarchaeum symbiosum A]